MAMFVVYDELGRLVVFNFDVFLFQVVTRKL